MCQVRAAKEEKITKKIASIATITPENTVAIQAKRRLNPAATEFVSSRSESEVSSIGDCAETEQPRHLDCEEVSLAIRTNRESKIPETQQEMEQHPEETEEQEIFHSYQNYGWESPQGVLPPTAGGYGHPGHYAAPLGTSDADQDHDYHYNAYHQRQSGTDRRARSDGGASPPPGPSVAYAAHPATAGMMPPPHAWNSSGPHSHHYRPSHYPVYHVYSHHPDGGVVALPERAASPPAIYPAGGSPPLAPGFISVPLQHQHSGHLRGSSPPGGSPPSSRGVVYDGNFPPHPPGMMHHVAMGSSPPGSASAANGGVGGAPGQYHVYAAPHPYHVNDVEYHPGNHYQYPPSHQYDNAMMAELQPRMSSMSLGSPAEGNSPTSSAIGIRNNTRASARIARSNRAGGAYNPSDFEFKISAAPGEDRSDAEVKTTVMIRNIPNKYTQEIMLDLLEDAGLNGTFDFFYLPIDFRNRCGLGYAFLNFLSHADAVKAYSHFHHRRWDEFNSKKVCEVTYARVQGRDNLVQHFKNAKFPSTDAEYCPLVYRHHTSQVVESEDATSTRVQAHLPLPIHEYLASLEEEQEECVAATTTITTRKEHEVDEEVVQN